MYCKKLFTYFLFLFIASPNDGLGSFQPSSAIDDSKMLVQSISAHPAFSTYSFDELRANYYKAMITPSGINFYLFS